MVWVQVMMSLAAAVSLLKAGVPIVIAAYLTEYSLKSNATQGLRPKGYKGCLAPKSKGRRSYL